MTPTAAASLFYTTAGTMKPDAPSYVERAADRELHDRVKSGEYCFVLTSRQMGKSSLMQRTARDLKPEGVRVAVVDLTDMGTEGGSEGWYYSFCESVHEQAGASWSFSDWWQREGALTPTRRLTKFLAELAGDSGQPLVIFVDEIDSTIPLLFSDDFFAAVRACYNARSRDARLERLTFVLLGVATPSQLIRDATRTPFNVGYGITLGDFTRQEAAKLGKLLSTDEARRDTLLDQVLAWTGGHPYLTQTMCKEVAVRGEGTSVDAVASELYLKEGKLQTDLHLKQTADRLVQGGRPLMKLYQRVRSGRDVIHEPASPLHSQLMLTGVVKPDERGRLRVRNRIYETVFGPEWIRESMPRNRAPWVAGGAAVAALAATIFGIQALNRQRAAEAALWDERAHQAMKEGKRDHALLTWLYAATRQNSESRLQEAADLVGQDYADLQVSVRSSDSRYSSLSEDGKVAVALRSGTALQRYDTVTAETVGPPLFQSNPLLLMWLKSSGPLILASTTFSSPRDGAYVLLTAWRAASGSIAMRPVRHSQPVEVAINDADRVVAIGGTDGKVIILQADRGSPVGHALQHNGPVKSLLFSRDGSRLFVDSWIGIEDDTRDGEARQWYWRTGELAGPPFRYSRSQFVAAFSPDGQMVATGGQTEALVWHAETRKLMGSPLRHQNIVDSVAFGPYGILYTGSRDGFTQKWDVSTGEPIGVPTFEPSARSVSISRDGQVLTTTGGSLPERSNTTRRWSTETSKPLGEPISKVPVDSLLSTTTDTRWRIDPVRKDVLLVGPAGTEHKWTLAEAGGVMSLIATDRPIRTIALSPDGDTLLAGSGNHTTGYVIRERSTRGKTIGEELPLRFPDLRLVAFSPDGNDLGVATSTFYYVFSNTSPVQLKAVRRLPYPAAAIRFVPDCAFCLDAVLAYPGDRGEIRRLRWDLANVRPLKGDPKDLLSEWERRLGLRVTPDGKVVSRYSVD